MAKGIAKRKPGLPKLTKISMEDAPDDTKWVESVKGTVNVAIQEIEHLRSEDRGLKLLDSADVDMSEFDVQVPDPWIYPTLTSGSPGATRNRYMKHKGGVVELHIDTTGLTTTDVLFSMPVGYVPSELVYCVASDVTGSKFSFITINAVGDVSFISGTGAVDAVCSISYLSSDSTDIQLSCWPRLIKTRFNEVSGVIVIRSEDAETTKPLPSSSLGSPVWELIKSGENYNVKINNIPGLPYNRKSRVRLLIIGGKNAKA